ncbi:MAG: thioredoxin domain-containing protein [Patescibacteria group bacterium]|nr:thioredoxin domain-containing protein [Patescibacteria group bacterium]MDD4304224.1 thioredoxin domain-containing protein [Patescibacteria group bacterium]MDD4695257.1 thioredoxin domain-containing protein [Patescibacteria group bacterium]
MHCPKCGHKLPNKSQFCTQCGNKILSEKNLEKKEEKEQNIEEKTKNNKLKGMGGWLSFFILSLIISNVLTIIEGAKDISLILSFPYLVSWMPYFLILLDVLIFGSVIAFGAYAIYSFIKLKPNAVHLGKMYLIIVFLNNVMPFIFSGETISYDEGSVVSRALGYCITWFLYLSLSERIKNTFPKEKRKIKKIDKILFFIVIIIALIFNILTSYILYNNDDTSMEYDEFDYNIEEIDNSKVEIEKINTEKDPSIGAKNPIMEIEEFASFDCPYSAVFYPVLRNFVLDNPNKVKIIFKDAPYDIEEDLNMNSHLAANCAYEQGKFWEMHDKIFDNQDNITKSVINQLAKDIDLDLEKFNICLSSERYYEDIEEDFAEVISREVEGTPTIFINGEKFSGVMSRDILDQILEAIENNS